MTDHLEEYQRRNHCLRCFFWDRDTLVGLPGCTYPGWPKKNKHTGLCISRRKRKERQNDTKAKTPKTGT